MQFDNLFDQADVQKLIDVNAQSDFGERDVAIIVAAMVWGLTPSELTLLRVCDVLSESGAFHRKWLLPESVAYNGTSRELQTPEHVIPFFDDYIDWRLAESLSLGDQAGYRGLAPLSALFLNDRGGAYKLSPRTKGGDSYQPRAMSAKLQVLIDRAGFDATVSTFRDSWIKLMYDYGCDCKELMRISGVRQRETIDRKTRPAPRDTDHVFKDICSDLSGSDRV